MTAIVLGASGFIGSHLAARIDCMAPTRAECDLRDPEAVRRVLAPHAAGADVIFAAGIQRQRADDLRALQDNIAIVDNLTELFRRTVPARVVFLGSVEVYGMHAGLPITERTPIRPETRYGVGKATAELLLRRWHASSGVPLAILRMPGIYGPGDTSGPGDKGRGFLGVLVRCACEGREFTLLGDGEERRDYVFVGDVVEAVTALLAAGFDEPVLNLATGSSLSLAAIMDRVFSQFGRCPVKRVPRTGDICHLDFDVSALSRALPGFAPTSLGDGLRHYDTGGTGM